MLNDLATTQRVADRTTIVANHQLVSSLVTVGQFRDCRFLIVFGADSANDLVYVSVLGGNLANGSDLEPISGLNMAVEGSGSFTETLIILESRLSGYKYLACAVHNAETSGGAGTVVVDGIIAEQSNPPLLPCPALVEQIGFTGK